MKECLVALYVFDEMGQLIASVTEQTMIHCCCILNLMEFTLAVFPGFLMQDYELDVQTFNAIRQGIWLVILILRLCEFNEKIRTRYLLLYMRSLYFTPCQSQREEERRSKEMTITEEMKMMFLFLQKVLVHPKTEHDICPPSVLTVSTTLNNFVYKTHAQKKSHVEHMVS
ncbi:hypothetical protein ACS0TY_031533 [Phlomoides rotata]